MRNFPVFNFHYPVFNFYYYTFCGAVSLMNSEIFLHSFAGPVDTSISESLIQWLAGSPLNYDKCKLSLTIPVMVNDSVDPIA